MLAIAAICRFAGRNIKCPVTAGCVRFINASCGDAIILRSPKRDKCRDRAMTQANTTYGACWHADVIMMVARCGIAKSWMIFRLKIMLAMVNDVAGRRSLSGVNMNELPPPRRWIMQPPRLTGDIWTGPFHRRGRLLCTKTTGEFRGAVNERCEPLPYRGRLMPPGHETNTGRALPSYWLSSFVWKHASNELQYLRLPLSICQHFYSAASTMASAADSLSPD